MFYYYIHATHCEWHTLEYCNMLQLISPVISLKQITFIFTNTWRAFDGLKEKQYSKNNVKKDLRQRAVRVCATRTYGPEPVISSLCLQSDSNWENV